MAAPMRSTDFRSIVEPILNECFDGIYEQRKDEYKQIFITLKTRLIGLLMDPSCTDLVPLPSCLMVLPSATNRVVCSSCNAMCTMCMASPSH